MVIPENSLIGTLWLITRLGMAIASVGLPPWFWW
jgi:hypothetical protein